MSDLYIGPNRISVDIETRAGVRTGPGPLVTVLSLDYGYRLSESGDFNAVIALADPRAKLIIPKGVQLAFYFDDELIFRGIAEHTSKSVDNAGILRLTVRGRDLTAELAESPVSLELSNGSGAGVSDGPADILIAANAFNGTTWSLDSTDGYSTTTASLYGKYSGESALTALIMAAQKVGEHFRVATDGTRKIVWLRTDTDDSGVRAVGSAGEAVQAENNAHICFIQSFREEVDAFRLITRIYPYGAGDGDMRLTLAATTRTAPDDFTLSAANNYISSDNAVTAVGKDIGLHVRFQDIRPISNTSADMTSAANQLFDAAIEYLKRHDAATDLKTFRLTVLKLPRRVQVGETIRVEYEDQGYSVDEDMVILAIRTRIDSSGVRVSELTVAGVARWLEDVSREIAGGMEQSRLFTSHPQRGPNSYVTAYQKHVWRDGSDSEIAKIRFRFGPEVCQLNQVAFDFETEDGTQMLPLESTVRSVAGVSSTTSDGGGSTPTTSSGGGSTPTTTSGGGSTPTTSSGGGSTPTSASGSSHTHSITIPNHSHDVPNHQHQITVAGLGTPVASNMKLDTAGGLGFLQYDGGSDVKINTNNDSGSVTSDDGGAVVTSSGAENAHQHTVTIPAHDHTVTIPSHQHTVTIPAHDHEVTANITTEYGVYRESDSLTFNLADLEYQINGGGWNALSTDVESIGSNWYRLDLTESLYDSSFFPNQSNNLLEFRRKTAGSFGTRVSCLIDGQLLVRTIIQSVSLT